MIVGATCSLCVSCRANRGIRSTILFVARTARRRCVCFFPRLHPIFPSLLACAHPSRNPSHPHLGRAGFVFSHFSARFLLLSRSSVPLCLEGYISFATQPGRATARSITLSVRFFNFKTRERFVTNVTLKASILLGWEPCTPLST